VRITVEGEGGTARVVQVQIEGKAARRDRRHLGRMRPDHKALVAPRRRGCQSFAFEERHRHAPLRALRRGGHADDPAPDNDDVRHCARM
jgi:hypothetical protein